MMRFVLLATLGSTALLLGAYGFQHLGGMAPCKLCLWQRWPHATAIVIGLVIMVTGEVKAAWLGAVAALSTAGIGLYHVGIEQGWWEGPTSCSSSSVSGMSAAGWNAIASLLLAAIWIEAARRA